MPDEMQSGFRHRSSALPATRRSLLLGIGFCVSVLATSATAFCADEKEGNGFYGIRWGTRLAEVATLRLVDSTDRLQSYELKSGSPRLGEANVDQMRFVAIEGEFARVSIHYSGEQNHTHMLAYLQAQFGPIERGLGSMMRGLNQQFTWRDPDTEVNLTYHAYRARGTVFIESRTLAPRFNDVLPEGAY